MDPLFTTINIYLKVWPLNKNNLSINGVTPDICGKYYFLFLNDQKEPINNIILEKHHQGIHLELEKETSKLMQINEINQGKLPTENSGTMSYITFRSSYSENKSDFYNLNVRVKIRGNDNEPDYILNCDPQVQNSPPPGLGGGR
ncbi:MAG: hypothetical protein JKY19_12455 [Alcanivoracaceae bacterium]|nr:hypothetical protein [Alcanivoracaceae bacterium]